MGQLPCADERHEVLSLQGGGETWGALADPAPGELQRDLLACTWSLHCEGASLDFWMGSQARGDSFPGRG